MPGNLTVDVVCLLILCLNHVERKICKQKQYLL